MGKTIQARFSKGQFIGDFDVLIAATCPLLTSAC
jgi:hypothetical protein